MTKTTTHGVEGVSETRNLLTQYIEAHRRGDEALKTRIRTAATQGERDRRREWITKFDTFEELEASGVTKPVE